VGRQAELLGQAGNPEVLLTGSEFQEPDLLGGNWRIQKDRATTNG
jgi:hypothetical protein